MLFGPILIDMHYLIYKITNRLDNKIYVGKHKTEDKDDSYFGSGLLLGRAVEKHGKENFNKEILMECSSEEEMNQKESDIVDEEFVSRLDTYNIMVGGNGGFDYINDHNMASGKNHSNEHMKRMNSEFWTKYKLDAKFRDEVREKYSNGMKLYQSVHGNQFSGKVHSDETKRKMSEAKKGKINGMKNPSYGKHWITNGTQNKLVKKEDVPIGWKKGRV